MKNIPLMKKEIKKEAFPPLVLGIAAILGLVGIGFGSTTFIRGQQENIAEDSRDLASQINDLVGKYPNSSEIVTSMVELAQKLAQVCMEMSQAANMKASNSAAISDFSGQLSIANQLIAKLENTAAILKSRESISVANFAMQQVFGRISDLKGSLDGFTKSLAQLGQEVSRNREQNVPVGQVPGQPPMSARQVSQPLSAAQKQQVIDFLNKNYQEGITAANLDDKLYELAADASSHLGVRVPGDKLQTADINKMRRLFEVLHDPYTAVGYSQ